MTLLLLACPELKTIDGPVRALLMAAAVPPDVMAAWAELVALPPNRSADEDDGY